MYNLISTDIFSSQIQNNLMEFARGHNLVDIPFCSLGKNFSSKPQGSGLNPGGRKHMFKRLIVYPSWII